MAHQAVLNQHVQTGARIDANAVVATVFHGRILQRGISAISLGRTLMKLGVERIHTEQGNRYRVVCLQAVQ